jgi:SIR2-like domain
MIDSLLSLAYSMHASKGVYALLLGSGISRASGILTGYEITINLIKKLAAITEEDCEPNPEEWYRAKFQEEPDYSRLIDQLARSPAERQQLLRGYFEPNDEEREQGQKMPTAGHQAIAKLVAGGHVRVIVTTNFDRLMEKALEAVGVIPTVISSPDHAIGALPLTHTRCTIIKINGDYIDTRIRNTPSELANYEPEMNSLLDRIFDEYGLVVAGWSSQWDTALRAAISRCVSRRFTTYWAYRNRLGDIAEGLINLRSAETIKIESADQFFSELSEKVSILDELNSSHPLSARAAVATAKKYLAEERFVIKLDDLVMRETTRLLEDTSDEHFPSGIQINQQEFRSRVLRYEALIETLLSLMITGNYWSQPFQTELWAKTLKRVANPFEDYTRTTRSVRDGLSLYPALLLMYGGGIAAVAAGNYDNLAALLNTKVKVINETERQPAAIALSVSQVLEASSVARWLPDVRTENFAGQERLFKVLRQPAAEVLPQDDDYQKSFDRFEYLLALIYADLDAKRRVSDYFWAPQALFASEARRRRRERSVPDQVNKEAEELRDAWPPMKAGLFDGSYERYKKVVDGCVSNGGFGV